MHKSYKISIFYFALFSLLLLASGAYLYILKIGFNIENALAYYIGSQADFTTAKSSYGLLEVALPHYGAMGLFTMVTAHFFLFGNKAEKKRFSKIAIVLFIAMFLSTSSGFLIVEGWEFFIYVKISSFITLELLSFYLIFRLLKLSFIRQD